MATLQAATNTPIPDPSHFEMFYSARRSRFAQTFRNNVTIPGAGPQSNTFISAEQYYHYRKASIIQQYQLQQPLNPGPAVLLTYDTVVDHVMARENNTVRKLKEATHSFVWTNTALQAWLAVQTEVLYLANFYKFSRHENNRNALLATGNKFIVEACPRFCTCDCGISFPAAAALTNMNSWRPNLLGKTLMMVRTHLQSRAATSDFNTPPSAAEMQDVARIQHVNDGRGYTNPAPCRPGCSH